MTLLSNDPTAPSTAAPGARGARPADLTERELQVVRLIASGHSNAEIAELLEVSINTVKSYVRTAYRRMGVTRRPEAAIWAFRHGLGGHLR